MDLRFKLRGSRSTRSRSVLIFYQSLMYLILEGILRHALPGDLKVRSAAFFPKKQLYVVSKKRDAFKREPYHSADRRTTAIPVISMNQPILFYFEFSPSYEDTTFSIGHRLRNVFCKKKCNDVKLNRNIFRYI